MKMDPSSCSQILKDGSTATLPLPLTPFPLPLPLPLPLLPLLLLVSFGFGFDTNRPMIRVLGVGDNATPCPTGLLLSLTGVDIAKINRNQLP
jgi:hypothetical protein